MGERPSEWQQTRSLQPTVQLGEVPTSQPPRLQRLFHEAGWGSALVPGIVISEAVEAFQRHAGSEQTILAAEIVESSPSQRQRKLAVAPCADPDPAEKGPFRGR